MFGVVEFVVVMALLRRWGWGVGVVVVEAVCWSGEGKAIVVVVLVVVTVERLWSGYRGCGGEVVVEKWWS